MRHVPAPASLVRQTKETRHGEDRESVRGEDSPIELVERASEGEEIVIAKAGTPRARLMPLAASRKLRKPGDLKGRMRIADDFDQLTDDVVADFYGDN